MRKIELLSPAKNLDYGIEAINHGADAVYIGAPKFGARVAAANTIQDIGKLVRYAHIYGAKVYVAFNTLLFDNEFDDAIAMINRIYSEGVDALIIQDLGLLEVDLPPIALHASTQTHNINVDRIKFLSKVGFERIILGRELSINQISNIHSQLPNVDLESFVGGALCVCYSGQCYLSQSINEHSGNRGNCSQPCRSSYNLFNEQGKMLKYSEHLLSLKDFSAKNHIDELLRAGISSFKIEGRLKDLSYLKNVTASYRKLIDDALNAQDGYEKSSFGIVNFNFEPDLERTFNRGFTDYFLEERKSMASFSTQKSLGKRVGKVKKTYKNVIETDCKEMLTAGDGLCYFDEKNQLQGCLVNRVEGNKVQINKPIQLTKGTILYRNNDYLFEKKLQNKTSERKIVVNFVLEQNIDGYLLQAKDSEGNIASFELKVEKIAASNPQRAVEQIKTQLSKTGDTPFVIQDIVLNFVNPWFIPAALINEMRRSVLDKLVELRIAKAMPIASKIRSNNEPYFKSEATYLENVVNSRSEAFYNRHGAEVVQYGLERTKDYKDKALMTTKYCLRFELGQCLKRHKLLPDYMSNLYLENAGKNYRLQFNCVECEMQIFLEIEKKKNN